MYDVGCTVLDVLEWLMSDVLMSDFLMTRLLPFKKRRTYNV